jgi:hypothetical protein
MMVNIIGNTIYNSKNLTVQSSAIFSSDDSYLISSDGSIPVTSAIPTTPITNPSLWTQFKNWVVSFMPSWVTKIFGS